MKKVLVDTNIIYEIYLEDSATQRLFRQHLGQVEFFVNIHILTEAFALFRARKKDHIAFRVLDSLLSEELFRLGAATPLDITMAAVVLKKFRDKALSFVDAIILAQAMNRGFEVWTTDKNMQHARLAPIFPSEEFA